MLCSLITTGRPSLTTEQDSSLTVYRGNDDQVIARNDSQTGQVTSTSSEDHVKSSETHVTFSEDHVTSSEEHVMSSQNSTLTLRSQVRVNATTQTVQSKTLTVQSRIEARNHSVLSDQARGTSLLHSTSNSISMIISHEAHSLSSLRHSKPVGSSPTNHLVQTSNIYSTNSSQVSSTDSQSSILSSTTVVETVDTTTGTTPTGTPTMRPGLYILMVFLPPAIFGTLFILLCPILCCVWVSLCWWGDEDSSLPWIQV